MQINEFNEFKFSGSGKDESHYILDESNYIIAIREDSLFSDRNIIPLYYITDDNQILGMDEDEIGNKILVVRTLKDTITDDISTRFHIDELFKIVRGPLANNEKHETDFNVPKRRIFKNYLLPLEDNEIIEIFHADIDVEKCRIRLKEPKLRDFINKKYIQTNRIIFILTDDIFVGPFVLNGSDDEGYFHAEKNDYYKFGVYDFQPVDLIDLSPNNIQRMIIADESTINQAYKSDFDFISDKNLLEWFFTDLIPKSDVIASDSLELVINQIERANNTLEIIESKDRYNRLSKILSNTKETFTSKNNLIKSLPSFQIIKEEIENLEKKKLEINNELSKKTQEYESNQVKIIEQQNELFNIEKKLIDFRQQEVQEQNKIREAIKAEIAELEKRKGDIDIEIEIETKSKSEKLENLKSDISYFERSKAELQTAIDSLKSHFTSEQKTAQEKLSDLVKQNTHFNFISGRDLSMDGVSQVSFEDHSLHGKSIKDYTIIRDEISTHFKNQQRNFDNHFIDNLLICIHQNTLTLFAGLPGTGKTSLAKLLTSALTTPARIREIPVARGWTSQKDMIGFANPLTKKFHEAQTGIYKLLQQVNYEWNEKTYLDSPLSYVILDEANLSPLEHYWSIFYSSTDSAASLAKPLNINLGQSEIINHANSIRFIGTINYDQTTEELSPRILDRTNIIRLMPKTFRIDNFSINEIKPLALSFENIIAIFKLHDFATEVKEIQMNDDLLSKYNEIKDLFNQKLNIYISPRVEMGIKRYCQLASTIMTENSRPLDYCIAQRLLPLINIQGKKKNELEQLLNLIKNFNLDNSVSENILQSIIEIGSRNGYTQDNYNYFNTLSHV